MSDAKEVEAGVKAVSVRATTSILEERHLFCFEISAALAVCFLLSGLEH